VRDRGNGISDREMERIFEPFFTTKPEGMGMGLAISRSIIQSHEGRLWFSANDDGGCTFHFTLPLAQES
jgi:signal transduction histidine kinase